MPDQWYYAKDNQQYGPVTPEQLRQLADSGALTPNDLIWKQGMPGWIAADQAKDLFPSSPQTTLAPPPPPRPANYPNPNPQIPVPTTPGGFAGKAKSVAAAVVSRGKAAAQLVAKQAERTKIATLNLPGAYQALGRHIYESGDYRTHFPDQHQQIDGLANEINTIQARSAGQPKAEGVAAKAKAAAAATKDAARIQSLKTKVNHALCELGKVAFDKYGTKSGPDEVTQPVAECLSRLQALDSEIKGLSQGRQGQVITPKRLAVAGVIVATLLALAVSVKMFSGKGLAPHNREDLRAERHASGGSNSDTQPTGAADSARTRNTARSGMYFTKKVDNFLQAWEDIILHDTGVSGSIPIRGKCPDVQVFYKAFGAPDSDEERPFREGRDDHLWGYCRTWMYRMSDGAITLAVQARGHAPSGVSRPKDGFDYSQITVTTIWINDSVISRTRTPITEKMTIEEFLSAIPVLTKVGASWKSATYRYLNEEEFFRQFGPPLSNMPKKHYPITWTYRCSDGTLAIYANLHGSKTVRQFRNNKVGIADQFYISRIESGEKVICGN